MYRPKSQQPILGLDIRTLRIYRSEPILLRRQFGRNGDGMRLYASASTRQNRSVQSSGAADEVHELKRFLHVLSQGCEGAYVGSS